MPLTICRMDFDPLRHKRIFTGCLCSCPYLSAHTELNGACMEVCDVGGEGRLRRILHLLLDTEGVSAVTALFCRRGIPTGEVANEANDSHKQQCSSAVTLVHTLQSKRRPATYASRKLAEIFLLVHLLPGAKWLTGKP